MNSYICDADLIIDCACTEKLRKLYHNYMNHRFDLLGSGFVKVNYEVQAKGLHGKKYYNPYMQKYGKRVKRKLCSKGKCTDDYEPINWFVDYKSGFLFMPIRYNSIEKCQDVIGKIPWVDIKCPWELGRLYHLVQLAVLAVADDTLRETIIREFRNEIIDFIEMNPVGKTVQWSSTMDISIRVVNMLVAYDILTQLDIEGCLDKEFQIYFEDHISKTLQFVMKYLEYMGRASTNHYLSNITGVIFAAAYLSGSRWVDACLAFGVQELIEQVGRQFNEEGSHFEGSTSYHRLSTELALYPTALIYGILKTGKRNAFVNYDSSVIKRLKNSRSQKYSLNRAEFFPEWFTDRLYNAGIFTKVCQKNNEEIVQIGDNDSGRLLKLTPIIDLNDENIEENVLDHRPLLSAMNGIFMNVEFAKSGSEFTLESSLTNSLSKNKRISGNTYMKHIEEYGNCGEIEETFEYMQEHVIFQDDGNNLLDDVQIHYFDKFGIVVIKGSRLFISMVIDTAQNTVHLGHTHNDKLSIEVMIDGNYITRDSGGYIYTAAPKIRDRFRSIEAHNTICCIDGREQNLFDGMWGMKKQARAELLYCAKNRIAAKLRYGDIECLRDISLTENKIIVRDFANKPFRVAFVNKVYSDGYGKLKKTKARCYS